MKISIVLFGLLITAAILVNSCTKDVVVQEPCFTEDVLPIFVSKCSMEGCHSSVIGKNGSGNHGYDLTNYVGIMKGVVAKHPSQSNVYSNCDGMFPAMPPNRTDKLTREQLSTIKYWINVGAPNSSNCKGVECDTSKFAFSADINPILKTNCVGCHSTANKSGGIDLSNYNGVLSTISSNKLLGSIKHSTGYIAMPPNINLNSCAVTKIEKWVAAGNPNN